MTTDEKRCELCGLVPDGYATINGLRYCHGEGAGKPSCFELAEQMAGLRLHGRSQ